MKRPPATDLVAITPFISANAAGLEWLAKLRANPDQHAKERCVFGPPWICPYAHSGQGFACLSNNNDLIVDICYNNWTESYEPIGQMSLFAPNITHRRVRRHWKTGEELPPTSPPAAVSIFCRKMAIAFIKWLENDQGWHVPQWRILPWGRGTNTFRDWSNQQILHHKMKPCSFEEPI